jgi:hypothetical protein
MRPSTASIASIPVLLVGLLAWAGDPAAPDGATPPAGAPRLEVETLVDLGQVVRGRTATAVFELKNTGDAELKILSAKPG